MTINCFAPKWNAPPSVRALFTRRGGGVSHPPFDSLNISANVGDDINAVRQNRCIAAAHLPAAARYLRQSHTARVLPAEEIKDDDAIIADGMWTTKKATICAVMVADCAPVLMATADGAAVAAVHAGWRGLAAGIIEAAAAKLRAASSAPAAPAPFVAWIGPAICAQHYPVGAEVKDAFGAEYAGCFTDIGGRLCADIKAIAKRQLTTAGATSITICGECTYQNKQNYFSARRDGAKTGRMAAFIWRQ